MNDFWYMMAIVATGFALNFGLRALPFVLFGSRKGELPPWVTRFGSFVSPVIIAGLIVYSYSGMQWRTAWPYLAGVVTVGLQVWKRNPLASIVAGTVVYMCLLNCGCTTSRTIVLDADNPSVRVSVTGVSFGDELVKPQDVPEILEDHDVPKTRVIHILLDAEVKDLREASFLMACLSRAGYTRPVLVTKRHSESYATGKKPKKAPRSAAAPQQPARKIRYKKATE